MSEESHYEKLIAQLNAPRARAAEYETTIRELGALGDPRAVERLGQVLLHQDGDPLAYRVRAAAAEALAQLNDPSALLHLIPALEDPSVVVRMNVVHALEKLNDARAVDALAARTDDPKPEVRAAIATALGSLGSNYDVNVKPVAHLLADPEDSVREAASEALVTMGAKSVDELLLALNSDNSTVRGAAADLLGRIGDTRAVEPLTEAYYGDSSRWVRSRAKLALESLPGGFTPDPERERVTGDPLGTGPRIASPKDTIELIRKQTTVDWPSLGKERLLPQRDEPARSSSPDTSADMSADEIQAMLDQLDLRLAKGEISEDTYKNLYARWETRLRKSQDD